MTKEQDDRFTELIKRGSIRVDIMDALRELIEEIESDAWERGTMAHTIGPQS